MTKAVLTVLVVIAAVGTGCSALDGDAAATWTLAPGQTLDAETTTFTVTVTRSECNSGVTGTVNDPDIELAEDEVVLTFTVSPGEPRAADCQGNDGVTYEVELPEALGDRTLVDEACRSTPPVNPATCEPDGVRLVP